MVKEGDCKVCGLEDVEIKGEIETESQRITYTRPRLRLSNLREISNFSRFLLKRGFEKGP